MGVLCLLYGQHLTRVVCLRVNINNFLFLFLRSAAKFYRKADLETTAGKMLTVCCRICLKNTHFKQMLSLFDTYKGFVIRDALLELFQIKILPTEMLSTICNACVAKVCTVRDIREEFIAQESKYQEILGTEVLQDPIHSQSPQASSTNVSAKTEPTPTVESTTEEQIVVATKSTDTAVESPIEQANLAINIDGNGKLLHGLGQVYDLDERDTPHSDFDEMREPEPEKSPEVYEITKLTTTDDANEEDIEIAKKQACNEESSSGSEFQLYSATAANSEEETCDANCMYICERCVMCFETDEAYESHACSIEEGESKRSCKKLPTGEDLSSDRKQTKYVNLADIQYECPHCSVSYEQDSQLLQHCRLYHLDEFEAFRCTICMAEYATQAALTDHSESQHPTGYRCRFCNKKLLNSYALKSHENVHTRQQSFRCTVCSKKFAQYTSLWRHMAIHNDIKAYECDICEKRFRQKSVMIAHRRTHTGEKPYACEVCSKCFRDHSTLAKHRRVHAKEKKETCKTKKGNTIWSTS
nr:zinc finger protein 239-like [Anopheles coluzzii]